MRIQMPNIQMHLHLVISLVHVICTYMSYVHTCHEHTCHMYIHVICTNMPYVHTCSRHMRRDQVDYKMLTNYCGVLQHYHFHVIECLFYPLSDIYATVHYLYWTTYTTYEIMQTE